jgi:hypothetical protein
MRVALALAVVSFIGVAHADVSAPAAPSPGAPAVDQSVCDPRGKDVVTADVNGDGKPDLWKLYVHGEPSRLVCKRMDLNFDGVPDLVVYYDAAGEVAMETYDLDFDGKVDKWSYQRGGRLVLEDIDTNGDGQVDLRRHYKEGKLARVERVRAGADRETGDAPIECEAGKPCACDGPCQRVCKGAGCSFECRGGGCRFDCPKGGCKVVAKDAGMELSCAGGHCDVSCTNAGCSITKCGGTCTCKHVNSGCSIE